MINNDLETELVLESDKDRGIHQPGIVQGMEYVDSNGNTRMKYETLHTYSSNTIKEMKEAADKKEQESLKVKQKAEQKSEVVPEVKEVIIEPKVETEPEVVKEKPAPKKRTTKPKVTKD
jgi:hypothetical protein